MLENLDLQIHNSQIEIKIFADNNYEYLEKIKLQYLKSLVMLIVSEYEVIIEKIFYLRAEKCNDYMLANFVKIFMDRKFRSPNLSKIYDTLKSFDNKLSNDFRSRINNTTIHAAWDNLIEARHYIVHKSGSLNLTYEELILSYPKTKNVLIELAFILDVDIV